MNTSIKNILQNNDFSKDDIIELLYTSQSEAKLLLLIRKCTTIQIMITLTKKF